MSDLIIDNYVIDAPIIDILKKVKSQLTNGKLKYYQLKGDNVRVTCPHHKSGKEDKASCDIYCGDSDNVVYGTCNCFTCHFQGPLWHFIAECFDESDDFAKKWLVDNFADKVIEKKITLLPISFPEPKKEVKNEFLDESILDNFQSWHPYMAKRKLSQEVCEKFEVKYDDKTKCIVFAVRDEKGKLMMLTRRSVEGKKFIIDADKEKPVYMLYHLLQNNIKTAIVTESQINCLTCLSYGLPAIALFGTGTKHQYDILRKSGIRHYILCFDGDEAGRKGAKRFIDGMSKDVFITDIKIPTGKDVNDLPEEDFLAILGYNRIDYKSLSELYKYQISAKNKNKN